MVKTKAGAVLGSAGKLESPPNCSLLVYAELRQFGITFSRKHILDLMRAGKFPRARQVGANRVAWLRSEVLAHINALPVAATALSTGQYFRPPSVSGCAPGRPRGSKVVAGRLIKPDDQTTA